MSKQDGERPYSLGKTVPLHPPSVAKPPTTPVSVDDNKELEDLIPDDHVQGYSKNHFKNKTIAQIQAHINRAVVEARKEVRDYVKELVDAGYRTDTNVGTTYFFKLLDERIKELEGKK